MIIRVGDDGFSVLSRTEYRGEVGLDALNERQLWFRREEEEARTVFRGLFGVAFGDEEGPPADCGRSVPEVSVETTFVVARCIVPFFLESRSVGEAGEVIPVVDAEGVADGGTGCLGVSPLLYVLFPFGSGSVKSGSDEC